MNKNKIRLIIFFTVIVLIAAGFAAMYLLAANTKEYSKGKDYITAITETVGKRTLTGVEPAIQSAARTKANTGTRAIRR